jgi:DNA ligase-1
MPIKGAPFEERWVNLTAAHKHIEDDDCPVKLTRTDYAKTHTEVKKLHDQYKKDGYEGLMVRLAKGKYEFGSRSSSLLKYKEFIDEEFEIIDVLEATGRDSGTAVFVCRTECGGSFNVRPEGSKEIRTTYLKDKIKMIGRMLTVRYQNRSDDNIPIFPVGVAVRDYE